jgi:hypothetical protein
MVKPFSHLVQCKVCMVKPILVEAQLYEVIVPFSVKRLQTEYPVEQSGLLESWLKTAHWTYSECPRKTTERTPKHTQILNYVETCDALSWCG